MWVKVSDIQPPLNVIVNTKIDNNGVRNEQKLKFGGKLWFVPDGTTYVYYTPTHWWRDWY
jgi:hypothetical protein